MKYIITGSTYNSSFLQDLSLLPDVKVMTGEALTKSTVNFTPEDKVYVPSETSLSIVMERMIDQSYVEGIEKLKNKYICRQALHNIFPDFYFAKASLNQLKEMSALDKKVVIKPLKGFFGTGVRIAEIGTDLKLLAEEMDMEVKENSKFFPESILSKDEYIIEEYISGDEFAVDMYYNSFGVPIIMNIYHHPEPKIAQYFHLMYYTNREIFDAHYQSFLNFFTELNKVLNLRGFPIHAEFKLQNGSMIPLELNPMRYGGFGLADLTYHSYGFQPITSYFDDEPVNWDGIWEKRKQDNYAWVLGYNGKDIVPAESTPKHEDFQKLLSQKGDILDYVPLDHRSNPVFALAYLKSINLDSLRELLSLEFNEFFGEGDREGYFQS